MTIRIPVKPTLINRKPEFQGFNTIYTDFKSKDELLNYIMQNYHVHWVTSSRGSGYQGWNLRKNERILLGINWEKRNRKTIQTKFKSGPNKGHTNFKTNPKVVRESHWVAWVYNLSELPVKVKQGTRNFSIEISIK